MLFVVGKGKREDVVCLVKADNERVLEERFNYCEGECILAAYTTCELKALDSAAFVVISG